MTVERNEVEGDFMKYNFISKSSLNLISLHDSIIQDLRVVDNDLHLYVNMINMTTDVEENTYSVAKQTDEALIVLKNIELLSYTKDHGEKIDKEKTTDFEIDDVKRQIKFGKSYIYDFMPTGKDEFCRELWLDTLDNDLLCIEIFYKESVMYWNEFVKDAWWVYFEKREISSKI